MLKIDYSDTFTEQEFREKFKTQDVKLVSVVAIADEWKSLVYRYRCPESQKETPIIVELDHDHAQSLRRIVHEFQSYLFA